MRSDTATQIRKLPSASADQSGPRHGLPRGKPLVDRMGCSPRSLQRACWAAVSRVWSVLKALRHCGTAYRRSGARRSHRVASLGAMAASCGRARAQRHEVEDSPSIHPQPACESHGAGRRFSDPTARFRGARRSPDPRGTSAFGTSTNRAAFANPAAPRGSGTRSPARPQGRHRPARPARRECVRAPKAVSRSPRASTWQRP